MATFCNSKCVSWLGFSYPDYMRNAFRSSKRGWAAFIFYWVSDVVKAHDGVQIVPTPNYQRWPSFLKSYIGEATNSLATNKLTVTER